MFEGVTFYRGHVRNTIIAFGSLFSNIVIQRKNNSGVVEQTIKVPIAYSQKDKWVHSIEQNPSGERGVYTALPRLGFEITGYSYDSARKLAKMNTIYCTAPDGTNRTRVFTPVPYNLDLSLYFATKSQEDGLQILEQILPTFAPDYTMAIKVLPELNIVQDVPFILNNVSVQDDYEGDLETRRFVIHTLSFTAKINFFGGNGNVGPIKQVEANVSANSQEVIEREYVASQTTPAATIIEDWTNSF